METAPRAFHLTFITHSTSMTCHSKLIYKIHVYIYIYICMLSIYIYILSHTYIPLIPEGSPMYILNCSHSSSLTYFPRFTARSVSPDSPHPAGHCKLRQARELFVAEPAMFLCSKTWRAQKCWADGLLASWGYFLTGG